MGVVQTQRNAGGLAGRNGRGLGLAVIQIRPLGLDGGAFRGIFGQRGPQEGAEAVCIGDGDLIFGCLTVEFRRKDIVAGGVVGGQAERGQISGLLAAADADAAFADIVAESRNLFRLRLAAGRAGVGPPAPIASLRPAGQRPARPSASPARRWSGGFQISICKILMAQCFYRRWACRGLRRALQGLVCCFCMMRFSLPCIRRRSDRCR